MKSRLFSILTLTAVIVTLNSCRKDATLIYNPEDAYYRLVSSINFENQWNYLWRIMDNQYVFWDMDNTDWDGLYAKYHHRFKALDERLDSCEKAYKNREMSVLDYTETLHTETETVVDELENDLTLLTDQHFLMAFISKYDNTRYKIQPSDIRLKNRIDYHPSLNKEQAIDEANMKNIDYEGVDYVYDAIEKYYGVTPDYAVDETDTDVWAYGCSLADGIFYLRMSGYSLSDNKKAEILAPVTEVFFSSVETAALDGSLKGIILDNRGNGGGYAMDISFFPGKFIRENVLYEKRKTKNGAGRYDYSPYADVEIVPAVQTIDIGNIPFVILQDMNSASMGEITGYACALSIPSAVTIGERTVGATGTLITEYPDIFHAGTANYANRESEPSVYTSTYSSLLLDKSDNQWKSFEGIGFEPDIYCPLDYEQIASGGRDTQLDQAMEYILSQSVR